MRVYQFDDYQGFDENDEVSDEALNNEDDYAGEERIGLEHPEEMDVEEPVKELRGRALLLRLRKECAPGFKECYRSSFVITTPNGVYTGHPMTEINPNAFVFSVDPNGMLKKFKLSEIKVTEKTED